jgi:hypothetical protein
MSHGTFASKLAREALKNENTVHFLHSQRSLTPFTLNMDLSEIYLRDLLFEVADLERVYATCSHRYSSEAYKTFDEYAERLEKTLVDFKPDITILAAAVSDYGGVAEPGKISSHGENLTINLQKLPKLINLVKTWCPSTYLVGFKLLSDTTEEALSKAAAKQIIDSGADLVVANDLKDLRAGQHQLYFFRENDTPETCSRVSIGHGSQDSFIEAAFQMIQYHYGEK